MAGVFLSLGSNLGDRLAYIRSAINELEKEEKIKLLKFSSVYNTQPWGKKLKNDFLNCVLKISTDLSPIILLQKLKQIEKKVGRKNNRKWSNREIDIDILFYDNLIFLSKYLIIPHPEIPNRRFILVPLSEIAKNFIHPTLQQSISNLLKNTKDNLKCEIFMTSKDIMIVNK